MAEPRALLPRREELVAQLREIEGAVPVEPDTERFERVDATESLEREHSSGSVLGG